MTLEQIKVIFMMTLDEQKLAICEKLPELISVGDVNDDIDTPHFFMWKFPATKDPDRIVNWPTEGLQICYEAEKHLLKVQVPKYINKLRIIVGRVELESYDADWALTHATYEQRLEALCRVFFPERFSNNVPISTARQEKPKKEDVV